MERQVHQDFDNFIVYQKHATAVIPGFIRLFVDKRYP
jgi:hypothetical protein